MDEHFKRKTPEEILQSITKLNKGHFKIILGAVSGAGKSYHLLLEGKELKKRSIDVVIGVPIDKHLRTIDPINELESIPPIQWKNGDMIRFDLDVEAIIKRNPEVVLVDELSHQNGPKSKNKTRLDDILELLKHKIGVITTLNIYELQELRKIAEEQLGVRIPVQHSIPEEALDLADEIRLLDVSPNVILNRLQNNGYKQNNRKDNEYESFLFKHHNLSILRELALRYVAEEVNVELDDYREKQGIVGTSGIAEKILVSVQYHWNGSILIRRGQQIAKRLGGDLFVVCFRVGKRPLSKNEVTFRRSIKKLVKKIEGEFEEIFIKTGNVAEELVQYAMKKNITRIIMGQSKRGRLEEIFSGSIINKILRKAHNIDVFIVADRSERNGERVLPAKRAKEYQPNPYHRLSKRELEEKIHQIKSGKLKIYIGAAPGVGKTYKMLREANELKRNGIDVIIGLLETHNRKETIEQIGSLELIPLKSIIYKNTTLKEMHTERIIQRNPEVVLVDELAHSNIPGSKHLKRYMDVEEILQAGISVISTMNIQHIESLNDVVYQILGIHIRETVPDYILSKANEIELIDISPEALRQRLQDGNIYALDKVDQSLNHFFKTENLIALRELALREVADDVDEKLESLKRNQSLRGPWRKEEVIFVCVNLRRDSELLIRRGFRIAYRLKARWYVCYIKDHVPLIPDEESILQRIISLTERLGGIFEIYETLNRRKVVSVLVEQLNKKDATQVIIGQSARTRMEETLTGSVVEKLLRLVRHLDVLVVADQKPNGQQNFKKNY